MKTIVVTGATGLIGSRLCERLIERRDRVIVFSRSPASARKAVPGATEYVAYDGNGEIGPWAAALEGVDAVVNLAGSPIFQRWTDEAMREIRSSRIDSTRALVKAMMAAERRPGALVSGSAVGYYGAWTDGRVLDESSPPGDDLLARLCVDWENEAKIAATLGIRTTLLRTGVVLDPSGGALKQLLLPFKAFVGGPVLPGTQWFSWIHREDLVNLILLALDQPTMEGPLDGTAPTPQTNAEFSRTLGHALNRPSIVPIPGTALTLLFGEVAEATLIKGQRVVPTKALAAGYSFRFPTSALALADLLP